MNWCSIGYKDPAPTGWCPAKGNPEKEISLLGAGSKEKAPHIIKEDGKGNRYLLNQSIYTITLGGSPYPDR
jgi:hypothetical protein